MPLTAGSRLGTYEILGPLGAGGMGEVFRARDSRLGRDVAIKVLPDAFAQDPERLARFEREARLLASLTHANIAGIHGLEVVDGHRHLILEFVDGETLANRLARGPLPLDEALGIASQIAGALDAAHEAGIVHRDLKPGNVMLTAAGDVKVLDFGLARGGPASSSDPSLSASPTMTYAATMAGVILGTAAYMSPEQARGKAVDRRTDIWSFGCVLYECLTARVLFAGETVSDTIAKILEREPDWSALPERTPPRVRELLRRCLEKDPKKRQRDAGDIRLELEEILAGGMSSSAASGSAGAAPPRGRPARLPWVIAGVSLVLALVSLAGLFRPPPPSPPPLRTSITFPPGVGLFEWEASDLAVSPDGSLLAWAGNDSTEKSGVWVRPLDGLEARLVARLDAGPGLPFWSPDSRRVAYFADGKLRVVGLDGNPPQVICDALDGRGGTWNADGVILFTPTSAGPIHRVAAAGGKSEPILELDAAAGETGQRYPRFLPDGRHFTFTSVPARDGGLLSYVGRLGSNERHFLASATTGAILAAPGQVVFARDNNLMVQRCNPTNWKLIGDPETIAFGLGRYRTIGRPAAAATASLLIFPSFKTRDYRLAWIGRDDGIRQPLEVPSGFWSGVYPSPDGRKAVAFRLSDDGKLRLWMIDTVRGTGAQMPEGDDTFGPAAWTPDGREFYYGKRIGTRQDFYVGSAAGSEPARPFLEGGMLFKGSPDVSPDGRYLLFAQLEATTRRDIWYAPIAGGDPVRLIGGPAEEAGPAFSPDGRWVVYQAQESGRPELWVAPFPSGKGAMQITTAGGTGPTWVAGTWEILYVDMSGHVTSIPVTPGPSPVFGTPTPIRALAGLEDRLQTAKATRDGRRFLVSITDQESQDPTLTVISNWQGLLEKP
ncbi:MAG TPA: protein kinase [Candidatus Eisenbacteria bacterium]